MSDVFAFHAYQQLEQRVTALETLVSTQGAFMASKAEELEALRVRLELATDEIAKDMADIRAKITTQTVTDADLARLDANIARLEAMGNDPSDPVPPPVEPPIEVPPVEPPA